MDNGLMSFLQFLSQQQPGGGGGAGFGGGAPVTSGPPSPGLGSGLPPHSYGGAQSPGLGMGTPPLRTYEDMSMGYPGVASANPAVHPNGVGDPLLILLQMMLNNRHPNGR